MRDRIHYLTVLAVVAIFLTSLVQAAAINVSPGQSIQEAIDAANPGDTIDVLGGIYHESLNISKPIILESKGFTVLDSGANGNGITLRADGIVITGFDIRTVHRTGLFIFSNNNVIKNNTISFCLDGIRLDHSQNNSISFNDINNNTNGITLYTSFHNTLEMNNIRDNNINEESDCGIFLAYSQGNIIRKNDLQENGDSSISLRSSSNNRISANTVRQNDWYGIYLVESSNKNVISENNASSNKDAGIYLDSSRNNYIWRNKAMGNAKGICLAYNSNDNVLEGNNLSDNGKGIHLATHSGNNTVIDNIAQENGYGISLSFSAGWNLLFNNHLIDNGYNAYDMGQNNRWDNGTIGNFYSDLGQIFYVPGGKGVDRHPGTEKRGI